MRALFLLVGLALVAAPAAAADWPTAHGTTENHRHVPSNVTAENVAHAERLWSFAAKGSVTGTPVHADGVAYFGDWGGGVHAVRVADGSVVWSLDHGAGVDSSLAIAGDVLLVADMDGNLTARARADGKEAWRTWVEPVAGSHLYGSPVPHAGRVYQPIASEQTDLAYEGPQDFRGGVACLDLETGRLLWKTYMQPEGALGVSVWSTPALDPELGLLFVGTGNAYGQPAGPHSDSIVALHMETGAMAWSFQATPNDAFNARGSEGADADFGASPVLFEVDGRKLVGDGDKDGEFYALDRRTGELVWETEPEFIAPGAHDWEKEGFLGTAAYLEGVLYAPTTDRSMVHALDARTGDVLWSRELNDKPQDYGDRMFGSTTVAEGVVLQGNAFGHLFALDPRDGAVLAQIRAPGDVQGGVSLSDDIILVPDAGGVLWDTFGNVTAYRVPAAPSGAAPEENRPAPSRPTAPPLVTAPVEPTLRPQAQIPAPWGLALIAALGATLLRGTRASR